MELFYNTVFCSILMTSATNYLPGLLSRRICEVTLQPDITPICNCVRQTHFDNLESLCRSLDAASDCIEQEVRKAPGQSPFLGYIFHINNFRSSMKYLCTVNKELTDTSECADNDGVLDCEKKFIKDLNRTQIHQEEACMITDKLSDCYWEKLGTVHVCPYRGKILYSQLAEAYLPRVCTKFDGESKGKDCQTFYPKILTPYSICVESVLEKADCLDRERKTSLHHEDIYWETGFDLDKFIDYTKLTCLIENERDRECYKTHSEARKACGGTFDSTFDTHISQIKNGSLVPEEEICSALEAYTECVVVAFQDCPIEATNLNSFICASMPRSCHCPVNLAQENLARSTSELPNIRTHYLLTMFTFFSVLLQ